MTARLDPTVHVGSLKVKSVDIHKLIRLALENVNRLRWVRADTFPGHFKKPDRGFEPWWEEYQALLAHILGQDDEDA